MREHLNLLLHIILTLIKLSKPGGVKAVMVENITMRQQLIALNRGAREHLNSSLLIGFCLGSLHFLSVKTD